MGGGRHEQQLWIQWKCHDLDGVSTIKGERSAKSLCVCRASPSVSFCMSSVAGKRFVCIAIFALRVSLAPTPLPLVTVPEWERPHGPM